MTLKQMLGLKLFVIFAISIGMAPAIASAQAGGGGAGMGGMTTAQDLQQIIKQLDLTADQQSKVKEILVQVRQDVGDAIQGLQDATPEDRRAKMQEIQKMVTDARDKVLAELTPEQKTKYFPIAAKMAVKRTIDLVNAVKTASADVPEESRKQLTGILDDSSKTLEGYKTDAEAVKDEASSTDFTQKITRFQGDFRKQLVDLLQQDGAQKLIRSARQSMRGGRGKTAANATTEPAN